MKSKPSLKQTSFGRFLMTSLLIAAAPSAFAQTTFFWDADGDATSGFGGAGTWDTDSSLWRSGSPVGPLALWPNSEIEPASAQFEGTGGTVTLNSESVDLTVNRMTFEASGYEIAGPSSGTAVLNLTGDSPRITTGIDVEATISADLSSFIGFNKTGAGTLTLSGNNTYSGTTSIASRDDLGGIVNVVGDQSAADGGWNIHGQSVVNFTNGSTISVRPGRNITLANSASTGAHSLNVEGTVVNAGGLAVRGRSTLNLESGAIWTQDGSLTIQPQFTAFGATVNVKTGSSFTYNGFSTITLAKSTNTGNGGANLTINGGTFTTARGFSNNNAGTGNGNTRLNFANGGTLRLSEDIESLIQEGSSVFGVLTNNAAGGIIDTNGFSTSINVAISGVGSLTKAGAGSLTLTASNTYEGDTTVSGGTLSLAEANLANDSSAVTISGSGVLELTYTGTDLVDKLFIGAIQQPAGVYGHSSTGATNGGRGVGALDTQFAEGTGTLTVTSNPVGTPFQIFIAGYPSLTGDDALPNSDPDGDGLSNLAEFIMGGTEPNLASAANAPVEAVIDGHLTISILVPTGAIFAGIPSPSTTVQGVNVAVSGALDLTTFARPVEETEPNSDLPDAPSGYEWRTFRLGEPISSQTRGFLRASFNTL